MDIRGEAREGERNTGSAEPANAHRVTIGDHMILDENKCTKNHY